MDTFLSLDIVGSALDLPQSNVPYPLCKVDGGWGKEESGGSERRGNGNLGWYV